MRQRNVIFGCWCFSCCCHLLRIQRWRSTSLTLHETIIYRQKLFAPLEKNFFIIDLSY